VEVVQYLVEHGADVNASEDDGATAVYIASQNGHLEVVRYLVEHGADVNASEDDGITTLLIASQEGHLEVVQYLVEHGADVNASADNGCTPVMIASLKGHLEAVQYLVEHGAEVNASMDNGWTPVMKASRNAHLDIVRYLVEHGADVIASTDGTTAIHFASWEGHLDMLRYLVEHCNINATNDDRGTPLLCAVQGGHLCAVEWLMSNGADVMLTPIRSGISPLMMASAQGWAEVVKKMLAVYPTGAACAQSADGFNAAVIADWFGHQECLALLKDAGVEVVADHPVYSAWREGKCTLSVTGGADAWQFAQRCTTCWPGAGQGGMRVCGACASICHKGHTLEQPTLARSHCHCVDESCQCNK